MTVLYLATPSSADTRAHMTGGRLGCIVTPRQGNRVPSGALAGIDNGCGPGKDGHPGTGYPGDSAYLTLLLRLAGELLPDPCDPDMDRCLFAAVPDVMGDAAATLHRAETGRMAAWIRDAGYPAAFVAQNGSEQAGMIPWGDVDALFLGGVPGCARCGYTHLSREPGPCPACAGPLTEWKLGAAARELAAEAHRRRMWVHMGRVNSGRRFRYASAIGCDSADGTFLTRGPDRNLPQLLAWIHHDAAQAALWDLAP